MSNQLRIQISNEKVVFPDNFIGVDTSNVLATLDAVQSYTATQDCWCMLNFANSAGSSAFYFNGIRMDTYTFHMRTNRPMFVLKAGDVMTTSQQNLSGTVLYGLKY